LNGATTEAASDTTPAYWDGIAGEWKFERHERSWRMLSDAVNRRLIARWLPHDPAGAVLKTDLFDEAVGQGIVPLLGGRFGEVTGIDISPGIVTAVRARFPMLRAEVDDVRALSFSDGSFDIVVSNSTLDHFPTHHDIAVALGELRRVLRPGGRLLITMDNPLNPIVALRNAMSPGMQRASRLVPFSVGATCGPRHLRRILGNAGFVVERCGAVFHSPRVLAVGIGNLIDRLDSRALQQRYVGLWRTFEGLGRLPSRYMTGYFTAALARVR